MLQASDTSLHEAVKSGDLRLVLKYRSDPVLMQTRDRYGFLPGELAALLGKLELVELFGVPFKPILCEEKGTVVPYSTQKFADFFGVQYVPTLYFENYSLLEKTMKECPWTLKSTIYGRENRLRGIRFREAIFNDETAPVYVRYIDSSIGYGLFAAEAIRKGEYIGTYAGRVRRVSRLHRDHNEYCLHYPTRWLSFRYHVVDAQDFGNRARFINHSDEPNLQPRCALDRNLLHTLFFALRDIRAGEELSFNYGKDFWQN